MLIVLAATLVLLPPSAAAPLAGRPSTFTGAVGERFQITATARPARARVGEAIHFTLEVRGPGSLNSIDPPLLANRPGFRSGFEVGPPGRPRIRDHVLTITYPLRPRSIRIRAIPPLAWSFYSSRSRRFETLLTAPIPIQVLPPARAPEPNPPAGLEEPRSDFSGLAPNVIPPSGLRPNRPIPGLPGTWPAVLLTPPALWLASRRLSRSKRKAFSSRRAARRIARRLPGELEQTIDRAGCAVQAFHDYLAARLGQPGGNRGPLDAGRALRQAGVAPVLVQRAVRALRACDALRFGPPGRVRSPSADPPGRVSEVLLRIDRERFAGEPTGRGRAVLATLAVLGLWAIILGNHAPRPTIEERRTWDRANALMTRPGPAGASAFERAAIDYRRLLDRGMVSGPLLFNLAGAELRAGDLPRAVVHLRQAELLRPGDPAIQTNLAWARRRVAGAETGARSRPEAPADRAEQVRLGRLLAAAFYLGGWILAGLRVGWLHARLPVGPAVAWLIALGLAAAAAGSWIGVVRHPPGVVIAPRSILRQGVGHTYPPVLSQPLVPGQELTVVDRAAGWIHIRLDHGVEGWIPAADAALVPLGEGRGTLGPWSLVLGPPILGGPSLSLRRA